MLEKLFLRMREIAEIVIIVLCFMVSRVFPQRHWVLFERGTDARDNAYWLYRYIKTKHPEQKIYYLINRASPDYCRVAEDAVEIGSIRGYWVYVSAQKRISTHYGKGLKVNGVRVFKLLKLYRNYYFLQHGVIKDDIPYLYGDNAPMDMFVCGAKPEFDYVDAHFRHPSGIVQYTGLARFDQLHNIHLKRQILVMPTWRNYIKGLDGFIKSDYFLKWQSFLNNSMLIDYLEKNRIELVFYVHYEMQKYIDYFKCDSPNVKIARFEDYDVQSLLKESLLLITDFSSVFFDFAYMRKPVVYYQFDEDVFFQNHLAKGYFDYRSMGFGEVCVNEQTLIDSVLKICANNMVAEPKYMQRIDSFFPLYDTNNCKRIYEFIVGANNEE